MNHSKSKHTYKNAAQKTSKLKKHQQKKLDKELDKALEGTFPASDPFTKY